MKRPHRVHGVRPWPWLGGWAAAHAGLLLVLVVLHQDVRVSGTLCSWTQRGASRVRLLETLTTWGNPWPVTLLAAGSACLALVRRDFTAAAVLVAVPYAAAVSCNLIKTWAGRQRPDLACVSAHADGFSFPSGHAVGVTTGFLLAALYAGGHLPRLLSTTLLVAAALGAEAVTWSRVLLGAHFSVDVLAGQLLGAGWLAVAAVLLSRRPPPGSRGRAGPGVPRSADPAVPSWRRAVQSQ
ncbi:MULTISPECIES: phosphatase PAP2 family protein [Streptomyces]|uniref:phosphatase PAP2 family protein n=1 Tax=Streptomyces TaxID=1883 RepID=UPI0007C87C17|nr:MULTISPECIES: phosphatase PAP2 family protein [unclassified Streptomyces]MDX6759542.1 phosphatase PAP2 family protein [Streptomyces sp. F8]